MLTNFDINKCRIPYLGIRCEHRHLCHICEIADRYRLMQNRENIPLFDYYDILPKTPKGGGLNYLYKPLIIKPESLQRVGIELSAYNQIFIATDGAGMFPHNPGSQIDGYFIFDRSREYTFGRLEFYGVPNEKTIETYKKYFLVDLKKFM